MTSSTTYNEDFPPPSLEELLAHGQWMRRFCRQLVGPSDAEDLAQETWMAALRRPPRRDGSLRAWLASVARNLAANERRRGRGRAWRERAVARHEELSSETELVAQTELSHLVAGEVLGLREPFRTTLLMRFVEGQRCAEIAARMNVAEPTVRTRIARGLEEVRQRLDARHGGERQRWLAAALPWIRRSSRTAWTLPAAAGLLVVGGLFWVASLSASSSKAELPAATDAGESLASLPLEVEALAAVPDPQEGPTRVPAAAQAQPEETVDRGLRAPRVAWHYDLSSRGAPLLEGEHLYVVGRSIAKLSVHDGTPLWVRDTETQGSWVGPGVLAGDLLLAAHTTGGVAAFRRRDGDMVWSRPIEELGTEAYAGRIAEHAQGALYVAPTRSGLVALRVRDGREVWRADLGGAVMMTPAVEGEHILAGTRGGVFCGVRKSDGSVAWRSPGHGQFGWTNPVAAEGVVYVGDRGVGGSRRKADSGKLVSQVQGNRGGALHAFRAETGEHLWGRIFGSTGLSEPYVEGEHVWIGFGSVCLALRCDDGAPDEKRIVRTGRNPFGTPRVLGEQLLFGNLDGHFYAHDAENGELQWAMKVGEDSQVGGWTAGHGRVFVNTTRGLVALEDTPDVEPVESGSRIAYAPPVSAQPETPETASPQAKTQIASATFESSAELSMGWLRDLNPSALSDRERELMGVPERESDEQLEVDETQRIDTLEQLQKALSGESLTRQSAALKTLRRCAGIEGIELLAPLVRSLATHSPGTLRLDAVAALFIVDGNPEDVHLAHEAWDVVPADQRLDLPWILVQYGKGQLRGRSAELVDELLADIDPASFRRMASGLWGADLPDSTSGRVVEFATQPQYASMRYDAIYYVLSTLKPKSAAVVDVLIDALADPNFESASRSLWGLTYGVAEADQPRVVEALLAVPDPIYSHNRQRIEQTVRRDGSEDQIARLRPR